MEKLEDNTTTQWRKVVKCKSGQSVRDEERGRFHTYTLIIKLRCVSVVCNSTTLAFAYALTTFERSVYYEKYSVMGT